MPRFARNTPGTPARCRGTPVSAARDHWLTSAIVARWHRHKAILAYLQSNDLPNTYNALREELGEDFCDDETVQKYVGLMERKWTTVLRLQKKVRVSSPSHLLLLLLILILLPSKERHIWRGRAGYGTGSGAANVLTSVSSRNPEH